jgi:hypothetical protein
VQGTTKVGWLLVHSSVCVQGTLLEKRSFLAQRLCFFLPRNKLAGIVSQKVIVVGVGTIVDYGSARAVSARTERLFAPAPLHKESNL